MIKTGNEGYIMTIDCNNEISWTIDAIHAWEITFEESWDTRRILKKPRTLTHDRNILLQQIFPSYCQ